MIYSNTATAAFWSFFWLGAAGITSVLNDAYGRPAGFVGAFLYMGVLWAIEDMYNRWQSRRRVRQIRRYALQAAHWEEISAAGRLGVCIPAARREEWQRLARE